VNKRDLELKVNKQEKTLRYVAIVFLMGLIVFSVMSWHYAKMDMAKDYMGIECGCNVLTNSIWINDTCHIGEGINTYYMNEKALFHSNDTMNLEEKLFLLFATGNWVKQQK
jgi:hypothetical protein